MNVLHQNDVATTRSISLHPGLTVRAEAQHSVLDPGPASRGQQALHLNYAPGSTVYRASDMLTHVFVVRSGLVKVLRVRKNGSTVMTGLAGRGQVIGFQKNPGRTYGAHAIALQPTTIDGIPMSDIAVMADSAYAEFERLAQIWLHSALWTRKFLMSMRCGKAEVRMAKLCLALAEAANHAAFFLPGRCDIAAILNLPLERSNALLTEFHRKGLLVATVGRHVVGDHLALRVLARDEKASLKAGAIQIYAGKLSMGEETGLDV